MINIDYKNRNTTKGDFLFRSLGSFWTQIFQDKEVLKGYTLGQAEEIKQRYFDLIEAVNNYSIKETQIFHTEKWLPITVLKSKFNKIPFVFEKYKAVFGSQPASDKYYHDLIFKFGFEKEAVEDVYQYFIGKEIKNIGMIADRVIAPNVLYLCGSDVIIEDGALTFNSNIFEEDSFEKFDIVGDNGEAVTYIDNDGVKQQEQGIIIWLYSAKLDKNYLYNNFGYIFDFRLDTSELYRAILEIVFNTFVNGPTLNNIKSLVATALQVPIIYNKIEVVQKSFSDTDHSYIVTDKQCYKINKKLSPINVKTGQLLYAGDVLCENFELFDNASSANGWWKKSNLLDGRLAFSKYLFLGNYTNQLSFSSGLETISLDENGDIVFPVLGLPEDVKRFNNYLNNSIARKNVLKDYFNLINPYDAVSFVPLDFIMDNFMKLNIAFIKITFHSDAEMSYFMQFIPLIRSTLPPYIYLIIKFNLLLTTDEYSNLNGELVKIFTGITLPGIPPTPQYWYLNADASNDDGYIQPEAVSGAYTNIKDRLFELSRALKTQPYEFVTTHDSIDEDAEADGRLVTVQEGALLQNIPANATTAQVSKLLFLDFS
jgi:hypothetical protein